ncbi:MAG: hypothetical protein QF752_10850, partial [Planctomycetota bacterium]|nr:hypothetical protein [Planctomycetota bacterium]
MSPTTLLFFCLSASICCLIIGICIRIVFQRVAVHRARRSFLLFLLGTCLLYGALNYSLVQSLRFEAGRLSCQAHLREIREGLRDYQDQRRVLPNHLHEIVDYTPARQTIMTCPVTGADYTYISPPGRRAVPNRPLCFDSAPHTQLSPWKSNNGRNFLHTSGSILWIA